MVRFTSAGAELFSSVRAARIGFFGGIVADVAVDILRKLTAAACTKLLVGGRDYPSVPAMSRKHQRNGEQST